MTDIRLEEVARNRDIAAKAEDDAHERLRKLRKKLRAAEARVNDLDNERLAEIELYNACKRHTHPITLQYQQLCKELRELKTRLSDSYILDEGSDSPILVSISYLSKKLETFRTIYEEACMRNFGAKARCKEAGRRYEAAREELRTVKEELEQQRKVYVKATQAHSKARSAYYHRLRTVDNPKHRVIAERAGVPDHYLDDIRATTKPDGSTHIYFGGLDKPAGEGHGHYIVNANGKVLYRRDPSTKREGQDK